MLLTKKWSAVVLCTIAPALSDLCLTFAQFIYANNLQGVNVVNGATATFGTGVSVCDFDGDGLDDISFGTKTTPPYLFRNTGTGFVQVPFTHPSPDQPIKSIIWVDIDNDGDRDLFLSYEFDSVRLYENVGDLELIDITEQSGLLMELNIRNAGASFGDYDNDGDLDLYLCKYYNSGAFQGPPYENILYRNEGNNTFSNVTYTANASVGVNASFNPVWWDYDQDGWLDLYIVNDRVFNQNYLLRNLGNGSFEDVSEATGVNQFIDAMGCALGDYNNDLLIDFFVPNTEFMGNYLYQHQANHTFTEVGLEAGVRMYELCWSGLWLDHENDGWLDLHVGAEINQVGQMAPNHLYRNNSDGTFTNITQAAGLTLDNLSTFSTAHGDWNNDGFSDFVCSNAPPAPSLLWQNIGGNEHYLAVTLEGSVSNRDAVGATIYAYAQDLHQVRYVTCSENHIAQNSFRKLFGLANHAMVDSLIIQWPRGLEERYYNLDVNTTHHFVEGASLSAVVLSDQLHFCENESITLNASVDLPVVWSTGEVATSVEVTVPGQYWYTLQMPQGFVLQSDTVNITSVPLSTYQYLVTQPSCFGANDGSIVISNSWGNYAISVLLNGVETGLVNENLAPGEYLVTVADQFGCALINQFNLIEPEELQSLLVVDPIACYGETTSVSGFAFGGNPPYILDWGGQNPEDIAAGTHDLTITDANGCNLTTEFSVQQPDSLSVEITHINNQLQTNVSGGTPPYSYFWVSPDGVVSDQNWVDTVDDGYYILSVTDDNGCTQNIVLPISLVNTEQLNGQKISLFPVPASKVVTIDAGNERMSAIRVFEVTGRLMATTEFEPTQRFNIQTTDFPSGWYTAEITFTSAAAKRIRFLVAH